MEKEYAMQTITRQPINIKHLIIAHLCLWVPLHAMADIQFTPIRKPPSMQKKPQYSVLNTLDNLVTWVASLNFNPPRVKYYSVQPSRSTYNPLSIPSYPFATIREQDITIMKTTPPYRYRQCMS